MSIFGKIIRRKGTAGAGREFQIIAVTGPNGITGEKEKKTGAWNVSLFLTAWRYTDSTSPVHEEVRKLMARVDTDRFKELRTLLKKDSVVKLIVRETAGGFELVELSESSCGDAEMLEVLRKQTIPVFYKEPRIGTFELNRATNCYHKKMGNRASSYILSVENTDQKRLKHEMDVAAEFYEKFEKWLDLAEETASAALTAKEESEVQKGRLDRKPLTKEEILSGLWLDGIEVYVDGSFSFLFSDNGLFGGKTICVQGNSHGRFTETVLR